VNNQPEDEQYAHTGDFFAENDKKRASSNQL
jgi:hypothetical protein